MRTNRPRGRNDAELFGELALIGAIRVTRFSSICYRGNLSQKSFSAPASFDFKTASGSRNGFSVMTISAFPAVNAKLPASLPMTWPVKSP